MYSLNLPISFFLRLLLQTTPTREWPHLYLVVVFLNKKAEDPLTSFEFEGSDKKPQAIPIVIPPTTSGRRFFDSRVGFSQSTAGRRNWKKKHPTGTGSAKANRQKKASGDGPIYAS